MMAERTRQGQDPGGFGNVPQHFGNQGPVMPRGQDPGGFGNVPQHFGNQGPVMPREFRGCWVFCFMAGPSAPIWFWDTYLPHTVPGSYEERGRKSLWSADLNVWSWFLFDQVGQQGVKWVDLMVQVRTFHGLCSGKGRLSRCSSSSRFAAMIREEGVHSSWSRRQMFWDVILSRTIRFNHQLADLSLYSAAMQICVRICLVTWNIEIT